MATKIHILVFICFVTCFSNLYSQLNRNSFNMYSPFNSEYKDNLLFSIENNNFIKNNEYFGSFVEGYTLIGYSLKPSFIYYPSNKFRLQAGAHIIKYDGYKNFHTVLPTFTVHTKLNSDFDLLLGTIQGGTSHKILEPLFEPERNITSPVEDGIQFLFNKKYFKGDIWLSWEQFIFKGDTIPEILTAGLNCEFKLNPNSQNIHVNIPIQNIITHIGGQISNYSQEMQSIDNSAIGLKLYKEYSNTFINRLEVNLYALFYKDLTESSGFSFNSGTAFYPSAKLGYKYGELFLGYWKSHNYYSPKGSLLFNSVSDYKDFYKENRQMITTKLFFENNIAKYLKFRAYANTYFDVDLSEFEYAYGINLLFNTDFFIHKIKSIK